MTPPQKIKWWVLSGYGDEYLEPGVEITPEYIDEIWAFEGTNLDLSCRQEGFPTDLPAPYSRYYECEIRAAQMLDGSWVAWPYWYGGGKHSEPSAMPWIEDAFEVDSWTEVQTVRCFKKKG